MRHILNDLYSTIPVHLLTTRSDQNLLQKVPIMSLCAMFGDASTTSEYSNTSHFLSGYGNTSRSTILPVVIGFPSVELFHQAQSIFRRTTRSVTQSIGSISIRRRSNSCRTPRPGPPCFLGLLKGFSCVTCCVYFIPCYRTFLL